MGKLPKELHEAADAFMEAGRKYRKLAEKCGIYGAVTWVSDTENGMAIFTRGENREILLRNIEHIGPTRHFGGSKEDEHEPA